MLTPPLDKNKTKKTVVSLIKALLGDNSWDKIYIYQITLPYAGYNTRLFCFKQSTISFEFKMFYWTSNHINVKKHSVYFYLPMVGGK